MIYWLFPFYCWFLLKYHWNEFWWSAVFSTEVLYHNGKNSLREKLSVFCCFLSHLFHGSVPSFLVQVELLLQFLLFSIYLLMFRKQTEPTGFSIYLHWNYQSNHLIKVYRFINLIVVLKVTTFARKDVNMNMSNCLSGLRAILIKQNRSKWLKIGIKCTEILVGSSGA